MEIFPDSLCGKKLTKKKRFIIGRSASGQRVNEKKFQHTMTVIAQCSHILKWSLLRNSIRRQKSR